MSTPLLHKDFICNGAKFDNAKEFIQFSKQLTPSVAHFIENWFDLQSVIEVKTSGSTGIPKTIGLTKKSMIESALATGAFFDLPKQTTALLCMSTDYIAGKMMLVRAMTLGWHLDIVTPTSQPLRKTTKTYDFLAMVPLQVEKSLPDLIHVKKLIVGGGAVSTSLLEKLQILPTEIYATYGMTETITHIAAKKLNHGSTSFYETLPSVNVSTDKRGCLVINAPRISKEKIITNDLANCLSNTTFEWLGRYDSVINSGGIKLIPEQIEQKIAPFISQRFFVAGIQDNLLGEKLILIIEGNPIQSILATIINADVLLRFEVPKEVYFAPQFIETPTKKIQRQKTLNVLKIR